MPIEEALPIAKQIAEALEAAHDAGIIHRDLKPANIKVRADGTVKVLDFGLAKAIEPGSGSRQPGADALSPTITSPMFTQAGMILGTAAYMAPEQAKGRPVDRRADIWAFGCVLYEMLTGARAFDGEDVTDILGAIVKSEPDWTRLPQDTPPAIRTLLKQCLQKDRKLRLDSAVAARLAIDASAAGDAPVPVKVSVRSVWPWMIAAVAIGAAAFAGAALILRPPATSTPAIRFSLPMPVELPFRTGFAGSAIAISPDGQTMVYTSGGSGTLVRRRLDDERFEVLPETGVSPVFSPDSKWLAYFRDDKLKKMPLDGGLATTICNCSGSRLSWGDDGSIVFAYGDGLFLVPSGGGTPKAIEPRDPTVLSQPFFLPGAKALLVTTRGKDSSAFRIQVLTLADGTLHDLTQGTFAMYMPNGDVLFLKEGQLWSAPLDANRLALLAAPAPVLDGVRQVGVVAVLSVALNGTMAYVSSSQLAKSSVVWIDRAGRATPAIGEVGPYVADLRLSPDGGRLALGVARGDGADIWVHDLKRGTKVRLTQTSDNRRPRWAPDGLRVAFMSGTGIYLRQADASGDPQPLMPLPNAGGNSQFPDAWTSDGQLIYNEGFGSRDLWIVRPGQTPVRLAPASPFSERSASVSPDGKWLVLASNESGRDEVYVQPFPGPRAKTVISTAGGKQPAWSHDWREIFYRADDKMMAVSFGGDPTRTGAPRALFDFPHTVYGDDPNRVEYDVAADGRFLAVRAGDAGGGEQIRVVVNWLSTLKREGTSATPK